VNGTKVSEPYAYDQLPTTAAEEPARWVVAAG
jgi:hypothetical protein